MSVISNTTVISNFAQVHQLEILHRLYTTLYIPSEVYGEIQIGLEEGYQFYTNIERQIYPVTSNGWIHLISMAGVEEFTLFTNLPTYLHAGEAACLAIAKQRNWIVLTDDQRARRQAMKLGIRVSGTIGCLVMGVEQKICHLEQANSLLRAMIEAGYRSPVLDLSPYFCANREGF